MSEAICTLFEKDYHHGVAALVNSLVHADFEGTVYAGYRGELPHWAAQASTEENNHRLRISEKVDILFIPLSAEVHFAHYKPSFMIELFEGPAAQTDQLHYLDPDIVLKGNWPTFRRWAKEGIALVEDPRGYMPSGHPTRLGWIEWLNNFDELSVQSRLERYYSSGYVGCTKTELDFLRSWKDIIEKIAQSGRDLSKLCMGSKEELFYLPDQEAMNIALMCHTHPINGVGQEGMDFAPYGKLLSHAIGTNKPWRGGFMRMAARGYAPTRAARAFLKSAKAGPIQSFSKSRLSALRLGFRLAVHLARIVRPTDYRFINP